MKRSSLCKPWEHQLTRRRWLAGAAGSAMGALALGGQIPPAIAAEVKKQNKQVLFVWLDGGMSQLESWDPKPNTEFGGPFRTIPTSVPGVHLSELLPNTAKQMHHLAVVRSLCTQDNAHSSGVERIQRGDPKNRGVVYPYFGSAVANLLPRNPSGMPPYVWIKPMSGGFKYQDAGFLGAKYGALAFGDGQPPENLLRHESVSEASMASRNAFRLAAERRYAAQHGESAAEANCFVYDMGLELMNRQELFDSSKVAPRDVERYGTHDLGRHMLLARRMLEAGVTFVKVNSYGWDTHGDNFNGSLSLVRKFDQPFAAIVEDLAASGMLDNVLVIAMSEFGRTPRINGHLGRDHWPEAWSVAMAGCGINRGLVVGHTDPTGTFVDSEPYDIGHMFHTWFNALGIDSQKHEYDNEGQPLPIANEECYPVKELLA
ncbi:DUF1501 domain-containing protein [Lignipirellula cremea]|uniref:DUF1501 domain-containing protein n=1 Tax=Lignipirellula cremea TaxID=2528010 RepID=A0A518DYP4_9BACT|nr:DUF1501 domain-containing protein [Lignipirellula cremea]QDU96969.1 hypothetical protein Pla8534_47940 [Lignipirellula cremea]